MISLQQLLGKDDKFFDLLEASAEEARASSLALKRLLQQAARVQSLAEFAESRRKQKHAAHEISEHVVRTFVSVLDREDVEALSRALYQIPKTIEKFAERFIICEKHAAQMDFSRQLTLLEKATSEVVVMVKHLRRKAHLEKIKEENLRLQQLEGEADKLILELLRDLYSGRHEVLKVIALKELYELLEKVIDRCRDAGNVVTHIILKHS